MPPDAFVLLEYRLAGLLSLARAEVVVVLVHDDDPEVGIRTVVVLDLEHRDAGPRVDWRSIHLGYDDMMNTWTDHCDCRLGADVHKGNWVVTLRVSDENKFDVHGYPGLIRNDQERPPPRGAR